MKTVVSFIWEDQTSISIYWTGNAFGVCQIQSPPQSLTFSSLLFQVTFLYSLPFPIPTFSILFIFHFFYCIFFFFFENLISNTLYSILLPLRDALAEILHLRRKKKQKKISVHCSSSMLKIWIIFLGGLSWEVKFF